MVPARTAGESLTSVPLVERIQSILASRDLTLYRVSQQSAALYGRSSAFFIPHNLYSDLRTSSFSPSLHQLLAFSRISGYRLADWLIVFGFDLEKITRLQALLPSKRTILLDASLTDSEDSIPWFRNRTSTALVPPIAPVVQFLEPTSPRKIGSLTGLTGRDFLYAKIGSEDAFAFPDLAPGSIVRVASKGEEQGLLSEIRQGSNRIFLIEHSKGFCCCPIHPLTRDLILPVGRSIPYARVPFRLPEEARILGVVDLEVRFLLNNEAPTIPKDLARRWKPRVLVSDISLGRRLRTARERMNLSLREAADGTRQVAKMSGNPHYRISASSLYDYEQSNDSPRDFRKIASLCSIYGLPFQFFLASMGMANKDDPADPMPDHLLRRPTPLENKREQPDEQSDSGLLQTLLARLEDLPLFLRDSLDTLSASTKLILDDFFWIGGERTSLHPYLLNCLIAIVNRRRKTAFHYASKPLWQQPIYLILKRDGDYLAACCGGENGTLVVHPYGPDFHPPIVFRNHQDAEVIGQIVAVARKMN